MTRLVVVLVALSVAWPSAQAPEVADLLRQAGEYLAAYEKQFSAVVSEERYEQSVLRRNGVVSESQKRELRSDVILINTPALSWLAFRDVFEVDRVPVRDRDARLQTLFLDTPNQALAQARRIMTESARYNIGSLQRNVNVPTLALTFLRADHQSRSRFAMIGFDRVNGTDTRAVSFQEHAVPTVIHSGEQSLPASGRFWIEPGTGRVVKTELSVQGAISRTKITVTYALQAKLSMWLPVEMHESYAIVMNGETIRGDATYSNFRQFKVTVSEDIK